MPSFVKKCVTIVERDGMNTEGLYRISGKKEDIMILQEKYDQGIIVLYYYFWFAHV